MKKYIEKSGYKYRFCEAACNECKGNCCSGASGYVWLSDNEKKRIAEFIDIDINKLQSDYLKFVNGKYSIKEMKINGVYYCVFFDTDKECCSIYDARPEQCRIFPFWEYYKDRIELLMKECPGVEKC